MNRAIRTYLRRVRRNLICFRKRERICRLHRALDAFAEDCPAPDYSHLVEAFGPPEEMAWTLMRSVPSKELSAALFWGRSVKAAVCVLLLVSFATGWMWGQRTVEVTATIEETTIIGTKTYIMDELEVQP